MRRIMEPEEAEEEFTVLEVDACERTCRNLTYVLNAILLAASSVVFSVGLFVWYDKGIDNYIDNLDFHEYLTAISVLMAGAMLVMLASFCSFAATFSWNLCLMITFITLTLISFFVNASSGAIVLHYGSEKTYGYTYAGEKMAALIWEYNTSEEARLLVDTIQYELACCGSFDAMDYIKIHMEVPNTCRDQITGNQVHDTCAEMVSRTIETYTGILSGIAFCTCFLQLFGVYLMSVQIAGILRRRRAIRRDLQDS